MSSLEFKNVSKEYSGNLIINNFSFSVADGDFVSFLGPSGCGKTTSLRIIAGLEKNSSGEVYIGEELVSSPSRDLFTPTRERKLGMVFQSYAIWPHMSVFENVAFPLRVMKLKEEEIRKRVDEILEIVELKGLAQRFPQTLSGGQQQRIALARGLVSKPKVLLLDEPLSNLDAKLREKMRKDIRSLQQMFKITCIYVTHDQVEAFTMSDKIMIMNNGSIIQYDNPEEIRRNPASEFVKEFIS